MSKRMVTYGVTDDKIASIDGHELGAGGVGDKSISRRMISYKVDDAGKIISIDGHELSGGGGGGTNVQSLTFKINVSTGDMNVGDVKSFISSAIIIDTTNTTTLCYVPFYFSTVDTPYGSNTATTLTITEYIEENKGKAYMKISIICLKAGKFTANLSFAAKRLYNNK